MKKKNKSELAHDLVAQNLATSGIEVPHQEEHLANDGKDQKTKGKSGGSKKKAATPKTPAKNIAPDKLVILVTIVNREKVEYFLDVIQSFQSNLQLSFAASGTAKKALGLLTPDAEKGVIFSVVTSENAKLALYTLNKKFTSIRGGKGVAFTVPMTGTIGVAIYRFLSNRE